MTDDLVTYLRARLDEDEAAARAADVKQGDPHWWVSPVLAAPGRYTVRSATSRPIARVEDVGDDFRPADPGSGPRSILDGRAASDHIARWDPARVLAEVAAKRRILDRHSGDHLCPVPQDPEWVRYVGCERIVMTYPCGDVLDLAQPYADRPDFRREWLT